MMSQPGDEGKTHHAIGVHEETDPKVSLIMGLSTAWERSREVATRKSVELKLGTLTLLVSASDMTK